MLKKTHIQRYMYIHLDLLKQLCDMIKGNESDVANIVFEVLAFKEFKFLFDTVFSQGKK